MKRSLFIAIVVLLMAALFVSCNADKAVEDQLFEVTIDGGARALQATAEFDVDIEQYYWFYTATKTSGGFRTGEKTVETAVQTTAGLKGANLGSFSKGTWEFSFFGYADPADKGTAAKRVFFQAGLQQTVNSAVSLAITLTRGEGALPAAKVVFDNPTWYHADFAILPANQTTGYALELKVFVGDSTEAWKTVSATTVDGKATFQFAATDALTLTEATTLKFRVYWGEDLVGSEDLAIAAEGATTYTVKDLNDLSGITPVDEQYGVIIFDASVPGLEATTATGSISVSPQDKTVVKAGVAPVASEQTTVTFTEGSFAAEGTHELTIEVSDAAASSSFAITNAGAAIAALSFNLDDATTATTFGAPVEIETYIQPGLAADSIAVEYVGTYTGDDAQPTDVEYDPTSGKLTFTVTHFSDYVVVSTKAVARIGNTLYESLPEACVAALGTEGNTVITLLCDASGDGFSGDNAPSGSYTIDFAGHTYDVTGLVGSTGTVSQAFRVISGQSVVLMNGTLTSSTAKMLINQYGNLTLKDMTLDGSNLVPSNISYYTLSVCLGNVVISGNTKIIAHADDANGKGRAFDIDGSYSGGTNRSVTISDDFNGKISGIIEFTKSRNDSCETKLIVKSVNGDFSEAKITISGLGKNDEVYINGADVYDLTTNTAYSLAGFRDAVNAGTITNDSVILLKDVDLSGAEWTPIGTAENSFSGVFDGNGKTISNFKVTEGIVFGSRTYLGFFSQIVATDGNTAGVKNLTIADAVYGDGGDTKPLGVVCTYSTSDANAESTVIFSGITVEDVVCNNIGSWGNTGITAVAAANHTIIENCDISVDFIVPSFAKKSSDYKFISPCVGQIAADNSNVEATIIFKNIDADGCTYKYDSSLILKGNNGTGSQTIWITRVNGAANQTQTVTAVGKLFGQIYKAGMTLTIDGTVIPYDAENFFNPTSTSGCQMIADRILYTDFEVIASN